MKKTKEVETSSVPTLYRVTLSVTEDMLGTAPSNKQVYSDFVASRALSQEKKLAKTAEEKAAVAEKQEAVTREELALLPEEGTKGVTVFRRDANGLVLTDTMIRGFLKEGAGTMGANGSTWGLTTKIDRHIFVTDANKRPVRTLPIMRDGVQVTAADDIFERPLRAQTMQGPRITLAASERIKAPVTLHFFIYLVGLAELGKNKPITPEILEAWFQYGAYMGLGQYRTGGHGRFDATVEVVE